MDSTSALEQMLMNGDVSSSSPQEQQQQHQLIHYTEYSSGESWLTVAAAAATPPQLPTSSDAARTRTTSILSSSTATTDMNHLLLVPPSLMNNNNTNIYNGFSLLREDEVDCESSSLELSPDNNNTTIGNQHEFSTQQRQQHHHPVLMAVAPAAASEAAATLSESDRAALAAAVNGIYPFHHHLIPGEGYDDDCNDDNDDDAHHHHHDPSLPDDDDDEPAVCRICGKADDRPILRFLPVLDYALAVMAAAPHVQTFHCDIYLHVFCGKTASILSNVNQPELEILTKAGLKNKHGIGPEVNAALSRTRCAILQEEKGTKEKQFYLVREFEANLAVIRHTHISFARDNYHHHQIEPPNPKVSSNNNNVLTLQQLYPLSVPPSMLATTSPSVLNNHHINNNNNGGGVGEVALLPSHYGSSPPMAQLLQSMTGLTPSSSSCTNENPFAMTNQNFQANQGNNQLSTMMTMYDASSTSGGSPTLEQLESMLQQQHHLHQLQQQQQETPTVATMTSTPSSPASSATKWIPVKAAAGQIAVGNNHNHHREYTGMTVMNNGTGSCGNKVYCECGGTHLPTHTTKGVASWRNHVMTKRHQKWMQSQNGIFYDASV